MTLYQTTLAWRKTGAASLLLDGRRRLGRVVPDAQHPRMWRSALSSGGLSDIANLSRAKSATLDAAVREVEYDRRAATTPTKCPGNGGVFGPSAPPIAPNEPGAGVVPDRVLERLP
jgi:hypothetical protein